MPHELRIRPAAERQRPQRLSRYGHIIRDGVLALAVFGLLIAIVGWNRAPLPPIPAGDVLAIGGNAPQLGHGVSHIQKANAAINAALSLPQLDTSALLQPTDRLVTVTILASVFAAIIAFNLWFLRHLSRVYASSRSGEGRRG